MRKVLGKMVSFFTGYHFLLAHNKPHPDGGRQQVLLQRNISINLLELFHFPPPRHFLDLVWYVNVGGGTTFQSTITYQTRLRTWRVWLVQKKLQSLYENNDFVEDQRNPMSNNFEDLPTGYLLAKFYNAITN